MYCTQQDLIDRFSEEELIQLTDRENMSMIQSTVVEQAIIDACAEMDGYLGSRYSLPLVNVPTVLKKNACDIARYNLYDEGASEAVTKRYDGAIKFLLNVSQGKISLGVSESGQKAQSVDFAEVQSSGSVFSRNKSQGFI